ncbi:MAG: hypothetical protein JW734_05430 [Candidatus Omnitrophica bacterium]|nr:hypothetical protein [Candidatus Omnitrophota bacterium]
MGKIMRVLLLSIGLFMIISTVVAIYYLFITKNAPPVFIKEILVGVLSGEHGPTNWQDYQISTMHSLIGIFSGIGIGSFFLWASHKLNKALKTKNNPKAKV